MKKYIVAGFVFVGSFAALQIFTFSARVEKTNSLPEKEHLISALEIPSGLSFAGETVPVDMLDVTERLDKELLVNKFWHSQTILFFKKANRWFPFIVPILIRNGIPEDFKYLALAESGLSHVISPAGATGFWQFMAASGKKYGLEINDNIDERYHVEKSTEAACKYLKEAYGMFGSWAMAAASYNMGVEGLKRQVEKQKQTSYFDLFLNEETARYYYRLVALKCVLENPEKYSFAISKKHLYPAVPVKKVQVDSTISDLVNFASVQGITYKTLKSFNPWLRQFSLENKTGKSYWVDVPDTSFKYKSWIEKMSKEDSLAGD